MLKIIDPITDQRWDNFITSHCDGNIFHHSAWTRVLVDKYGETYKYYATENENGEITGALPFFHINNPLVGNQLVCLPSSDSCPPLANSQPDLKQLIDGAIQEIKQNNASSIQIRGWSKTGLPEGCEVQCGLLHSFVQVIDLQRGLSSIREGMTRNGRYNLRSAEKQSMAVKSGQDEKDLKIFYRLLIDNLRKHHVLPPPYSYFHSIFKHIIIAGRGFLYFTEFHGKIISANLYFCFKDTALCSYSAQLNSYSKYRPNYFLHWKAIEDFHSQSYKFYDFGGTDPNNQGLLFFKRSWGGTETTRSFYYYPYDITSKPSLLSKPLHWGFIALERCLPNTIRGSLSGAINKYTID
ncbi:MAG: peptidoglycan bridge formation glycyltransferase FemA/FemB family protein [Dehalococcoidales bacterium]|nr:peptidoglycan bridge formation glycyltransferase FemA/FemB family protein [Dehalococcoidales bacterium]